MPNIILELPDWAMAGQLRLVLNDMELVAYKEPGLDSPWFIKTGRCNNCGECCLFVGETTLVPTDEEFKCAYLTKNGDKWLCNAGAFRPAACLGDPSKDLYPDCSVEYKQV